MEEKTPESAIDIIYQLPALISELKMEILSLKAKNNMLEQKLSISMNQILDLSKKINSLPVEKPVLPQKNDKDAEDDSESSEIMDIVTPASPKKAKATEAAPFSFKKPEPAPQILPEPVTNPVKSTEPMSLDLNNKKQLPKVESAIKIPYENIDLDKSLVPEGKQTSVILKGRFKEREGITPGGVEVKVYNDKSVCIKKTKTASTGEWLAMLPAGDYTVEFSKVGMKPLMKTITVIPGRKEMEVLI